MLEICVLWHSETSPPDKQTDKKTDNVYPRVAFRLKKYFPVMTVYEDKQAYMAYKSRLNNIAEVYWWKIKTFIHNL